MTTTGEWYIEPSDGGYRSQVFERGNEGCFIAQLDQRENDNGIRALIKAHNATLTPAPTNTVSVDVAESIRQILTDVYVCGRVWEAWQHGTMTQDDFSPAAENDDIVADLVALFDQAPGVTGGQVPAWRHTNHGCSTVPIMGTLTPTINVQQIEAATNALHADSCADDDCEGADVDDYERQVHIALHAANLTVEDEVTE